MDKIDMFQSRLWKVDKFGWWDLEWIQYDAGALFTSKDFQEGIYVHEVRLTFSESYHQEINGQFEVTWRILSTITH